MKNFDELFRIMTTPSQRLIADFSKIKGDILVIGAGGKIGPSLTVLAKNTSESARTKRKIIAASVFASSDTKKLLKSYNIETIDADLLNPKQLKDLPDVPNIIFMAGRKFGTHDNQPLTWAINTLLPSVVAQRFPNSRMVTFSTGNVYGMRHIHSGGALEEETLLPVGEYAQSCLGRERVLTYWANQNHTPMMILRLNYAIDMRYGVLYDIANTVISSKPVDLSTGYFNCIWQGDVGEYALRSLLYCDVPPNILNITGPESISVKYIAQEFGKLFDIKPKFIGVPPQSSLFSNASKMAQLLGYPNVSLNQMITWTVEWIKHGGHIIEAPTHFEQRDGKY